MAQINVQRATNPDDRKSPIFEKIEQMTQKLRERAFAIFAGHRLRDERGKHGMNQTINVCAG